MIKVDYETQMQSASACSRIQLCIGSGLFGVWASSMAVSQADRRAHAANKNAAKTLRAALHDFEPDAVKARLSGLFQPNVRIHLAHPFETLNNHAELFDSALLPLFEAIPDLERRETIAVAGRSVIGNDWVGCAGYYTGTFRWPWLEIPPTGHMVSMRFHGFFRMEGRRVAEMQALWDIPEVMMRAGAWPMSPSLGREWHVPGPATQDGLAISAEDRQRTQRSLTLVSDMLAALGRCRQWRGRGQASRRLWASALQLVRPVGDRRLPGIRRIPQMAPDPVSQRQA